MGQLMAPKPDKYIDLDLTLIGCIETFAVCISGVIRRIRDDTNILRIM